MPEIARLILPPDEELATARRQFVELYGTPLVTNHYLRIALVSVSVVCLGLLVLNLKTVQAFHTSSRWSSASMTWAGPKPWPTIR